MTDPMASVEPLHRPGKKTSGPALSPKAAEFLGKATVAADFKPHLDRPYVVKNWLTPAAMSVVYGDSNVGKTFFALDLGYHVAGGRTWNGCKVRGGPVLYIAAEGGHGFGNRIAALEARDGVPLWTLPTAIDLCKADADTKALIELIAHLARHHGGYALIVVDTLARAMGSGDENASPDMGALTMPGAKTATNAIRQSPWRTGTAVMVCWKLTKPTFTAHRARVSPSEGHARSGVSDCRKAQGRTLGLSCAVRAGGNAGHQCNRGPACDTLGLN